MPSSRSSSSSSGESLSSYKKGGYHPVRLGDKLDHSRYVIRTKLGWGQFSTVWVAQESRSGRDYALKIVKSAPHYTEAAYDEVRILNHLSACRHATTIHPGHPHMTFLYDSFTLRGPNGTHMCLVLDLAHGESLLSLIRRHRRTNGAPLHLCKQVAKQCLLALDFIHRVCSIIHTDLKPENIMVDLRPSSYSASRHDRDVSTHVYIIDFGNATPESEHYTDDIQTRQYRAPEVIIGAHWGTKVDIWSLGCVVFELVTATYLFDPHEDIEGRYERDEDHLSLITEIAGRIPRRTRESGKWSREFFDRRGDLRHIRSLRATSLDALLRASSRHASSDLYILASFLIPMLEWDPERRGSAYDMLTHRWLGGMVLQGELDLLRHIRPAASMSIRP